MSPRLLLFTLIATVATLHARVWTTADHKTFEANYVSATATSVSVKVPDGRIVPPVELRLLGQADRNFIAQQLVATPAAPSAPAAASTTPKPFSTALQSTVKKGPYDEYLVSDWKQFGGRESSSACCLARPWWTRRRKSRWSFTSTAKTTTCFPRRTSV